MTIYVMFGARTKQTLQFISFLEPGQKTITIYVFFGARTKTHFNLSHVLSQDNKTKLLQLCHCWIQDKNAITIYDICRARTKHITIYIICGAVAKTQIQFISFLIRRHKHHFNL